MAPGQTIEHSEFRHAPSDGVKYFSRLQLAQQALFNGDSLRAIGRAFNLTKGEVLALKPKATGRFFVWDRVGENGPRACVSAEVIDPLTQTTNAARMVARARENGADITIDKVAFFSSAPDAWAYLFQLRARQQAQTRSRDAV